MTGAGLATVNQRYVLHEALGHGAMGVVYRAYDRLELVPVALKRIQVAVDSLEFSGYATINVDGGALLALTHEFQTLASMKHPHIISVLDYGFHEREPFFTMEYLDGAQNLLDACNDLAVEQIVEYLIQTLQALAYLHQRGVIHRDLKPDNILVSNGRARALDFGLAATLNEATGRAGTMAYIAPEVLRRGLAVEASDLYAVGVIAYQLFSGILPFDPKDVAGILTRSPDLSKVDAPKSALPVIDRLLRKDPAQRYETALETIAAFREAFGLPPERDSLEIRESYLQAALFVGREAEINQLAAALDEAMSGRGSSWLIGGESGIGKSRLLDEVRTRALVEGAFVARGQAVEGGGLPYQLWRNIVRRLVIATEPDDLTAAILQEIVPDIDRLLERKIPPAPALSGMAAQQRIAATLIAQIEQLQRPVILLLEDLQWTHESLTVLDLLNKVTHRLPILIIATYRDDERPDLPDTLPEMELIKLSRLSDTETAELCASMLGAARVNRPLLNLLNQETEGNIFFLIETLRALADEAGSLSRIDQLDLPQRVIAGGVQDVARRRLQRAPQWTRRLLQLAAVHGRRLDLALLDVLHEPNGFDLDHWLTVCVGGAILDNADGRWRFAHDKLREAVLNDLTPDELATYSREVAEATETLYADNLEPQAAALARHWSRAGDPQKEGFYSLIAAKQANRESVYSEAIRYYQRAIELQTYSGEANPVYAQADVYSKLGDNYQLASDYVAAREWQNAALGLFQQINALDGVCKVQSILGDLDTREGKFTSAKTRFDASLELTGYVDDVQHGLTVLNAGILEATIGNNEAARDLFEKSYHLMRDTAELAEVTKAINNLAITHEILGDKEKGLDMHEEALAIRRRINDRRGVVTSLINISSIKDELGAYDEALAMAEEALSLSRDMGQSSSVAYGLNLIGTIRLHRGELEQARANLTEALEIRRKLTAPQNVVQSLNYLSMVAYQSGEADAARAYYHEAFEIAGELETPAVQFDILHDLAQLLQAKKPVIAAEILAFLDAHQDAAIWTKNLDEIWTELREKLNESVIAVVRQRAEQLSFEQIAARALDAL